MYLLIFVNLIINLTFTIGKGLRGEAIRNIQNIFGFFKHNQTSPIGTHEAPTDQNNPAARPIDPPTAQKLNPAVAQPHIVKKIATVIVRL
jgi:hypothetical protein